MREIKFRAWDKIFKKMYNHEDIKIWDRFMEDDMSNQYESLMQYTGINDNSDCFVNELDNDIELEDKEIYEDDIINFCYNENSVIGVIKYSAGSFMIVSDDLPDGFIPINEITNTDRDYSWIDGIVIGNIYENPELLLNQR